jgi:glycosyltransferase involved in cell wall biosynthesis
MVLTEYDGRWTVSGWERQLVESVAACGVETELFCFRNRRSPTGLLDGAVRLRRAVKTSGADVVHVHYGSAHALASVLASTKPVIVSLCGSDVLGSYNAGGKISLLGRISMLLSQFAVVGANRVIAKSDELKDRILWAPARARCEVIPNGVDLKVFLPMPRAAARAGLGWTHEDPVVLFTGGRAPGVKDPALAEKAVEFARERCPALRLHFVEGEPRERMPLFYNAADVLLVTSRHEGSNNSVKEAMACDLPVVSTSCGDVPERLSGVKACHVCDRDPAELGARVAKVVAARMRSDGRDHIKGLSSVEVARRIVEEYRRATGEAEASK